MASNGKRPRSEPPLQRPFYRTNGVPFQRQRLASEELSDLEYPYSSSSDDIDGESEFDGSETPSESLDSLDMDRLYKEEQWMLLEEEEAEEEEDELEFSTEDEDTDYEEAMDRELARVELDMLKKQHGNRKTFESDYIMDSDEEMEAWQYLEEHEWNKHEHLLQQQQQQNDTKDKPSEEPDWDTLDAINRRFLMRGNVAKKPCTMTSSVGVRRSRISMVGQIVPAKEMLRNYFRDARRSVRRPVKENSAFDSVVDSKEAAATRMFLGGGAPSQRKALSERNL